MKRPSTDLKENTQQPDEYEIHLERRVQKVEDFKQQPTFCQSF
jgi:hypothetical protein